MRNAHRYILVEDPKSLAAAVDATWDRVDRQSRCRPPAEREDFKAAIDQARAGYQRLLQTAIGRTTGWLRVCVTETQ